MPISATCKAVRFPAVFSEIPRGTGQLQILWSAGAVIRCTARASRRKRRPGVPASNVGGYFSAAGWSR